MLNCGIIKAYIIFWLNGILDWKKKALSEPYGKHKEQKTNAIFGGMSICLLILSWLFFHYVIAC